MKLKFENAKTKYESKTNTKKIAVSHLSAIEPFSADAGPGYDTIPPTTITWIDIPVLERENGFVNPIMLYLPITSLRKPSRKKTYFCI